MKRYRIIGPEGFPSRPDPVYGIEAARAEKSRFIERFRAQSYYSAVGYRSPFDELADRVTIELYDEISETRGPVALSTGMKTFETAPFVPLHSAILGCETVKVLAGLLASHPERETAKGCLQILAERSGAFSAKEEVSHYQIGAEKLAKDGEIEVDDEATVSMGGDDGAYVQVWLWVSDEMAGMPLDA